MREVAFASHAADLMRVRVPVFVEEQGVPIGIEADDRDAVALHVLATGDGVPVGTGRLDAEHGKIGRVAILASWRSRGVGQSVMQQLHRLARRQGLRAVWCNAQASAVPFYEKLGYRCVGEPFEEAGIPHREMHADLRALAS